VVRGPQLEKRCPKAKSPGRVVVTDIFLVPKVRMHKVVTDIFLVPKFITCGVTCN